MILSFKIDAVSSEGEPLKGSGENPQDKQYEKIEDSTKVQSDISDEEEATTATEDEIGTLIVQQDGQEILVKDDIENLQIENKILMGVTGGLIFFCLLLTLILLKFRSKDKAQNVNDVKLFSQDSGPVTVSIGKVHEQGARSGQQDSFAVSPESLMETHGLLTVVADGMGGLSDGDKVSQTVVSTMVHEFLYSEANTEKLLLHLAQKANHSVNQLLGDSGRGKSGSTMVAGLIRDGLFYYLSVGDSRICLFRDGELLQLNREHIYAHELALKAMNNNENLEAVCSNPDVSGLTSYMGMGKLKYADIPAQPVKICRGDKFILMSDGVYNALDSGEISDCLMNDPETAAQLIDEKIRNKAFRNQDNYTAVILSCTM